ncbi:MAG: hypothetical protein ACQESW_12185 [Bacteroidota bacterium]
MKYISSLLLVLLLLTAGTAKDYKDKQFGLFRFNLSISKDFEKEMKPLEDYIENIELPTEVKKKKLKSVLIHHIYYHIEERLEKEAEFSILPVNSFMDEIKYNDFGYPESSINEVIRLGYSQYFFRLDVAIKTLTKDQEKLNPKMYEDLSSPSTFPQLTISMAIYDKNGIIPLERWNGTATAAKPLALEPELFAGFDRSIPYTRPKSQGIRESLYSLLDYAIDNLIKDIND